MNAALRYPSFYLVLPIVLALSATIVSFKFSISMLGGLLFFMTAAVAIVTLDAVLNVRLPPLSAFRGLGFSGSRQGLIGAVLCFIVVAFCLIDITAFPIPLIDDPTLYATFDGGRNYVRHVSNLSWILPPLSLLCFKSRVVRMTFIAIGLVFPILVIDRNRLFAALFSLVFVLFAQQEKSFLSSWKVICGILFAGVAAFSILGTVRSGRLDGIALPFSTFFHVSPESLKWLLLYASAGIYNFSAILAKGYHNAGFLMSQIGLHGPVATLGTDIPLDAPTINVGTEFFPFLMAFGWGGALVSVFALYAMLLLSVALLREDISLWRLLLFLRIAYVSVMSPFAPQAFTWTNFGFVGICLMIPIAMNLLPSSTCEDLKEK